MCIRDTWKHYNLVLYMPLFHISLTDTKSSLSLIKRPACLLWIIVQRGPHTCCLIYILLHPGETGRFRSHYSDETEAQSYKVICPEVFQVACESGLTSAQRSSPLVFFLECLAESQTDCAKLKHSSFSVPFPRSFPRQFLSLSQFHFITRLPKP